MAPKVERLTNVESTELGEGPHWDADTQSLYYVDIIGKSIHRYVPATQTYTKAVIDTNKNVSLIIPVRGEKNKFVVTIGRQLVLIDWDGVSKNVSIIKILYEVENDPDSLDNRINDGKCDPSGRIWAGTMGPERELGHFENEKGSLYTFQNGQVKKHLGKIGISNGLAWNAELKKMYYNDTLKGSIYQYDFDIEKGTIGNGKPIFTLEKMDDEIVGADGMTIDTDGNLWVAVFNGSKVIKIDPRKPETLLQTIPIPAKQVTSVAFGGPNLDELYVTSGKFTIDGKILPPPEHGGTYKVTGLNAKGYPGISVVL
ncbi:unnamed protein product [Phaedon cochleariae]|uniref:Regucalcin n=1 Tax=Phaedon cochleariae TaxID=80249 RepID=A0A9P0DHT8_PHACE|nr:unnamed protein product [Phaedon cochleariae]